MVINSNIIIETIEFWKLRKISKEQKGGDSIRTKFSLSRKKKISLFDVNYPHRWDNI